MVVAVHWAAVRLSETHAGRCCDRQRVALDAVSSAAAACRHGRQITATASRRNTLLRDAQFDSVFICRSGITELSVQQSGLAVAVAVRKLCIWLHGVSRSAPRRARNVSNALPWLNSVEISGRH